MANPSGKTPEERLDALEMRTNALSDAVIVQGYLQGRIERNPAKLSDKLNALTNKVNDLSDNVHDLFRVTQLLADNQSHIQVAFEGLIGQIDRSIRSQQGNSHPTP